MKFRILSAMLAMLFLVTCPLFAAKDPILAAEDPYVAANNSWISLNGTIVTAGTGAFELDYGEGIITVEMDGWDWYNGALSLLPGDNVTVYGRVDDDLYEKASIEANSVYVKNLNTYYYANDADEEDLIYPTIAPNEIDGWLQLSGLVSSIDGREFTINTGTRKMKVDTIEMLYNPMDDKGYQQIKKGDYVQVTGHIDKDVFEKTEVMANSIITLAKDKTKKTRDS